MQATELCLLVVRSSPTVGMKRWRGRCVRDAAPYKVVTYISLTDMAKARTDSARAADIIKNWLRARSTLEFLGTWELMYNPNFKVVEFDHFKAEAERIKKLPEGGTL